MRLALESRRLKVIGIGATLREGSTSLGRLLVELAGRFSALAELDLVESLA